MFQRDLLRRYFIRLILLSVVLLSACTPTSQADSEKIQIVTSSQIVGDVVSNISRDLVDVTFLISPGTDPHAYEPAPRDAAQLAEADLIFINGLGLEETLQPLLNEHAKKTVDVSAGIQTLVLVEEGESGPDPHVWTNPQNVKLWVDNIAEALAELDPQNADAFATNAVEYKTELDQLDEWAMAQIAQIPAEERVLVTDHEAFGYFAEHYGFEIVGVVIPGYSTLSESSAGELAALETAIDEMHVQAIFVGVSMNPSLANQVAQDTGVQLIPIYTESLSDASDPASTYLEMIRFDVETIVAALK
jgi:ABC-type Zn uptake system ZnuABC Zn-binding protein ZnuA